MIIRLKSGSRLPPQGPSHLLLLSASELFLALADCPLYFFSIREDGWLGGSDGWVGVADGGAGKGGGGDCWVSQVTFHW